MAASAPVTFLGIPQVKKGGPRGVGFDDVPFATNKNGEIVEFAKLPPSTISKGRPKQGSTGFSENVGAERTQVDVTSKAEKILSDKAILENLTVQETSTQKQTSQSLSGFVIGIGMLFLLSRFVKF